MPRSSVDQGSFAGGQWGPLSQGRFTDPHYSTAMSLCLNGFPMEETAWTVRSGTMFTMPTVGRTYAKLLPFSSTQTCSFAMEFTNGAVRFDTPYGCVCTNDGVQTVTAAVDTGGAGSQIKLSVASLPVTWNQGDLIQLVPPSVGNTGYPFDPVNNMWYLQNRVLSIGTISGNTFLLNDDLGNPLGNLLPASDVAWVPNALVGCEIVHHAVLSTGTNYTTVQELQNLRAVQAEIDSIILSGTAAPFLIQISSPGVPASNTDPVFVYEQLNLMDGPYLDPQLQTLTISGYSGTITLATTIGTATTANVFAATDVGRSVRIFTQPPAYVAANTYAAGATVTDVNGAWWVALQAISANWLPGNLATIGGISTAVWAPSPGAGTWAWGTISAVASATSATFIFDTRIPGMVLNSANSDVAFFWQLGVYSDTTSWPTCGAYFQGRLWLGGAVPNRFDTTCSNGIPPTVGVYTALFSPTDPYNNVLDNSGMSYILNAGNLNEIQWMLPDAGGLLMGTEAYEFLIGASTLSDPITPTSIQDYPKTRYGSTNQDAIRVGMAGLFVQRNGRRILEYIDDAFSSKPTGRHLNENAKNLSVSGVQQLAYTEEPVPMVWALMNNGMMAGCTYRRFSRFVQTEPDIAGWHWNIHGSGNRVFTSMCAVPESEGTFDYLFTVTNLAPPAGQNTPGQADYYVEIMQPPQEPPVSLLTGFLADTAGGWSPGTSLTDCGGMNQTNFTSTGWLTGEDTASATVPPAAFFPFTGYGSGASPPWGCANVLGPKGSVFFPGSVMLYNIPPWGSPTDVTEMSISVWIGTQDGANYGSAGALVCPPHLDKATYTADPDWSGAEFLSNVAPTTGNPVNLVTMYGAGGPAVQTFTPGSTPPWCHIMISVQINTGTGAVTCTAYHNDTQICAAATIGTLTSHTALVGPFASSVDKIGNDGLNVWAIGGQCQVGGAYSPTATPLGSNLLPASTPTLLEALNLICGSPQLGYSAPPVNYFIPMGQLAGTTGPTLKALLAALAGQTSAVSEPLYTGTFQGGTPNTPYSAGTFLGNDATGYIGNVAELWVMPGTFIDWTQSVNRDLFHEYDSGSGKWGPIPLGLDGSLPLSAKPWIYLSGPPPYFYLNRAPSNSSTGVGAVALSEWDTSAPIVNFQTGQGGGLQTSTLVA